MNKRQKLSVSTTTTATRDYSAVARFGEDAERPLILLKIPADVATLWKSSFERGGVEGPNGLDPQVLLATVSNAQAQTSSTLTDGDLVHITNPQTGEVSSLKVSFKKTLGAKARIISSEVSANAEHVKFEGYLAQSGALTPANLDDALRANIRKQVLEAERKPTLGTLSIRGERDAMMKTTFVGNVRANASAGGGDKDEDEDDDDDDDEQTPPPTTKGGKRTSSAAAATSAAAAAGGPATKKRKKDKKEKKDWSPESIRMELLKLFEEKPYWKRKELREHTGIQFHKMNAILGEICDYHTGGDHDKHYSLKRKD